MPRAATTSDPFNAIAEPRRRDILEFLAGRERPVADIVDEVELAQPSVSKHLRVLLQVGLVDVRREGRQAFYRTNTDQIKAVHDWTRRFERYWRDQLSRVKERAERTARTRPTREGDIAMTTASDTTSLAELTIDITEEIRVRASLEDAFAALLEELGPENRGIEQRPMPMVLEAKPGGRWFRDLGDGNGHLWGHVQAIRRPTLLEIAGPLMMSFAVASNVQYRLQQDGDETVIMLRHTALGLFPDGYKVPLTNGWKAIAQRISARLADRG